MKKDLKVLDCFGDICPLPIIKIENELKEVQPGDEFMLVTDHSCTLESIRHKYSGSLNARIRIEEVMNGVWEVYFKKL